MIVLGFFQITEKPASVFQQPVSPENLERTHEGELEDGRPACVTSSLQKQPSVDVGTLATSAVGSFF